LGILKFLKSLTSAQHYSKCLDKHTDRCVYYTSTI